MGFLKKAWRLLYSINPLGMIYNVVDAIGEQKVVKDIVEHGINSKYVGGVKDVLSAASGKYLDTNLTPAQQAMNQFNADEAEKARQFEKQMSDTAFQRQVADMQAAGVNPALAMGGSSSGASTPSGQAASASALSGSSDLLGMILSLTMQNKQLSIQQRIADRELDLREQWQDREYELGLRDLELKTKSTDKLVQQMDANIAKMAEETNNEHKRGLLLDLQKRISEADATTKEAFAKVASDVYAAELNLAKARTSNEHAQAFKNYEEALLAQLRYGYEQKLYTDEYIDSIIQQSVEAGNLAEAHTKYFIESEEFNQYLNYCKEKIMSGQVPGEYTVRVPSRKSGTRTIKAWNKDSFNSARKGMGLDGPSQVSDSWSKSYNTQYFGGQSKSGSSTKSWNAPF